MKRGFIGLAVAFALAAALPLALAFAVVGARAWFVSPMMTSGQAGGGGGIPTASLSASPSSITSGASSTLTWGSTNAASCTSPGSLGNTAIPGFTGAVSGSASVSPTANTTYSVQCGTATASAGVTVTGGGGLVACDYGPPTTLPTGAAGTDLVASGNTHCVLNADFTDQSNATVGTVGSWVMNNPNTWLKNCSGSSTWGQLWLNWTENLTATNGDNYSVGAAPCNRASLISDGAGSRILNFQFLTSEYVVGHTTGLGLWWPICGINSTCFPLAPALPTAYYSELTFKLASGVSQPSTDLVVSLDSSNVFDGAGSQPSNTYIDTVFMEALSNNDPGTAFNIDNYTGTTPCGGKCSSVWFKAPDLGNYHTYASLSTTNGTSTLAFCEYIDNAGISGFSNKSNIDGTYCAHTSGFLGNSQISDRNRRLMLGIGDSAGKFTNTVSIYVKSIRIFACPLYRSSQCTGPIVWH